MSSAVSQNRDNFCYRHPDRMSFVLCQRCLRTICPDCQTQSAVGVVCPECMKQQKAQRTPAQRKADRRWRGGGRASSAVATFKAGPLAATYSIIAVTVFVWLLQIFTGGLGGPVTDHLRVAGIWLAPDAGAFEPWRAVTTMLVHSMSPFHIGFNMLSLLMMGRILEPMLGHARFIVLYLISGIAGSVLMGVISPFTPAVGASGAVFGMFGALIVIVRRLGGDISSILVIVGINLVFGFVVGGVAWQAHVGGLIGGLAVGAIYATTRRHDQRTRQILLLIGVGAVLIASLFLITVLHPFQVR